MFITKDLTKRLFLNQKNYLYKVLEKFRMKDAKLVSTQLDAHFKLSVAKSPQLEEEKRYMAHVHILLQLTL